MFINIKCILLSETNVHNEHNLVHKFDTIFYSLFVAEIMVIMHICFQPTD